MKRSLIALAVGGAFAAPAAYADVTLSGSINMGPAIIKQGDGSTGASNTFASTGAVAQQGITRTGINTNYTNVTIGSMEDLGGGLKLDFAFQMVAPTNGNVNVANRNSHIGLTSDSWGGVWWGSNENLYERYFYTVDPLDGAAGMGGNLQMLGTPGFGTVFDAPNGTYGPFTPNAGFYRRTENTIWYDSPNWGGFTFGAYTTLSAFKTNSAGAVPGINPRIWGIGGKYVGPAIPIQAWVAYENHKDLFGLDSLPGQLGSGTSSKDSAIQVGLGYTIGDIFLFVNFERLKYENDGVVAAPGLLTQYKRNAESIGLKWNIPTGYVGAQVVKAQNGNCTAAVGGCDASETKGLMIGAGYYHTLSKQTSAYVMATYIKNGDLQSYLPAGGGTNVGTGVGVNLGGNIWGATVGLKHSF